MNNPLKYSDPSGDLFGIDDAIIFSVLCEALYSGGTAQMNGGSFVGGFLKGAVIGAASAAIPYGIGEAFGHELGTVGTELLRAGVHGLGNGLLNVMQGGSFGSGFATGAVASLVGSGAKAEGFGPDGVIGACTAAGAGAAALTGGNWMTGAMQGMDIGTYNHAYARDLTTGRTQGFSDFGDDFGTDMYENGHFNTDGTFTSTAAPTFVDWPHASTDIISASLGILGTGLSSAESMQFRSLGFMAKFIKCSSQSLNTVAKVGGKGLGFYNGYSTLSQYNNKQINFSQMITEEASNAISMTAGGVGPAWGIGWEGGRVIYNTDWYQQFKYETIFPLREKYLGY